jgi:hypothetical protein
MGGLTMTKAILLAGAILIVFSLIFVPLRSEKVLTFAWQQQLREPNDLAGWRLYQSHSPGGPYALIESIPFKEKQNEYRVSRKVVFREGDGRTLHFVLRAFDTSGNESRFSNEVSLNLKAREFGILGYDVLWSKKEDRAVNYARMIMQVAAILVGTGAAYWFVSRRRAKPERTSVPQEVKKSYYCATCAKQLEDLASVEVHRAFKHEVRERHEA